MEDVKLAGRTALVSFILYLVDPFSMLFTIPMHYQGIQGKNYTALLFSTVCITAAIAVRELLRFRGIELKGEVLVFFLVGFGIPAMLAVITGAFHLLKPMNHLRRLGIVLGSVFLLGFLLILLFEQSSTLSERTVERLADTLAMLFPAGEAGVFSHQQFAYAAVYTFQRTFLLMLSMQFGIGYSAAWKIWKKRAGKTESLLDRVHLPEKFIWVLLISWTVILLDIIAGLGTAAVIGWNIGLTAAMLYVLQGLAVFRVILNRRRRNPVSGFQLCMLLEVLMFIPGINMMALTALGILGVTEIWIAYRRG